MIQSYLVALQCMSNEIYEFFYVFYFHSNFQKRERERGGGGREGREWIGSGAIFAEKVLKLLISGEGIP